MTENRHFYEGAELLVVQLDQCSLFRVEAPTHPQTVVGVNALHSCEGPFFVHPPPPPPTRPPTETPSSRRRVSSIATMFKSPLLGGSPALACRKVHI